MLVQLHILMRLRRHADESAHNALRLIKVGFLLAHGGPYIMNTERTFLAPFAKTERTKTQIQEFQAAIKTFIDSAGYGVVREVDVQADEEIWGFRLTRRIPNDLNVRAGEIIHNLRSALDQMTAELAVRISNKSDSKVEFPFGRNVDEFEIALGKQKKLPPAAKVMIRELQPYQGGNPILWLLHSVNRRDKHRMGLVPIQLRSAKRVSYLVLWYGVALVMGSRKGQHLINERRLTDADYLRLAVAMRPWGIYGTTKQDLKTGRPFGRVLGPVITSDDAVPGATDDGMEFLTTTPGAKFETDFQPSFDIAFRDVGTSKREPIIHILTQLRDLVERILLTFERRFFP
jgi:hypothetical protein